jgi:hypothetical protein
MLWCCALWQYRTGGQHTIVHGTFIVAVPPPPSPCTYTSCSLNLTLLAVFTPLRRVCCTCCCMVAAVPLWLLLPLTCLGCWQQPMSWHAAWLAALCLALLEGEARMLGSCSGRMASLHTQMSGRHRWVLSYVVLCRATITNGVCMYHVAREARVVNSHMSAQESMRSCWAGARCDCSMVVVSAHSRNRAGITLLSALLLLFFAHL